LAHSPSPSKAAVQTRCRPGPDRLLRSRALRAQVRRRDGAIAAMGKGGADALHALGARQSRVDLAQESRPEPVDYRCVCVNTRFEEELSLSGFLLWTANSLSKGHELFNSEMRRNPYWVIGLAEGRSGGQYDPRTTGWMLHGPGLPSCPRLGPIGRTFPGRSTCANEAFKTTHLFSMCTRQEVRHPRWLLGYRASGDRNLVPFFPPRVVAQICCAWRRDCYKYSHIPEPSARR